VAAPAFLLLKGDQAKKQRAARVAIQPDPNPDDNRTAKLIPAQTKGDQTMTRMIKAIQIDPFDLTVSEIEFDASNFTNIYPLLSHETMKVDTFAASYSKQLAQGDAVFVDDEGLMKGCSRYFNIGGETLVGKGLIIGSDNQGNEQSAQTPLKTLRVMFFAQLGRTLIPIGQFNGNKVIEL
jgi:hypothetical protein